MDPQIIGISSTTGVAKLPPSSFSKNPLNLRYFYPLSGAVTPPSSSSPPVPSPAMNLRVGSSSPLGRAARSCPHASVVPGGSRSPSAQVRTYAQSSWPPVLQHAPPSRGTTLPRRLLVVSLQCCSHVFPSLVYAPFRNHDNRVMIDGKAPGGTSSSPVLWCPAGPLSSQPS